MLFWAGECSKINRYKSVNGYSLDTAELVLNTPLVKSDFQEVIFSDFQNATYNPIKKNALKYSQLVKIIFFTRYEGYLKRTQRY